MKMIIHKIEKIVSCSKFKLLVWNDLLRVDLKRCCRNMCCWHVKRFLKIFCWKEVGMDRDNWFSDYISFTDACLRVFVTSSICYICEVASTFTVHLFQIFLTVNDWFVVNKWLVFSFLVKIFSNKSVAQKLIVRV